MWLAPRRGTGGSRGNLSESSPSPVTWGVGGDSASGCKRRGSIFLGPLQPWMGQQEGAVPQGQLLEQEECP